MSNEELGDRPTPTTEEPELHPGGVDAVVPTHSTPLPHDLDPADNAAVDESMPEEVAEPDDEKEQAPDDGRVSGEDDTEEEPPA